MYKRHSDPPPFLLFLHLQKTAGMTLQELLRRHYGKGIIRRSQMWYKGKTPEGLSLSGAIERANQDDNMFVGHFCFGIHEHLNRDFTYLTMLREPAARLISLYHYSHDTPGAHYFNVAKNHTLESFLFDCKLPELDNGITRLILGGGADNFINRTQFGKLKQSDLEQAKLHLENHFSFVGIQEMFDESILLLAELMGWKTPYYVTLNVRKQKHSSERVNPELVHRLRERNQLDCDLYNWCKERFLEAWNREFSDPELHLSCFQKRNARYQILARPVTLTRMKLTKIVKGMLTPKRSSPTTKR